MNDKPYELLLLGLPREIFYYILDFICQRFNNKNMHVMHRLNGYCSRKFSIFMENFKNLMYVNKKIRQWTIFYIEKKYNLLLNMNGNFEINMQLLSLTRALHFAFVPGSNVKFLYLLLKMLKKSIQNITSPKKIKLWGEAILTLYLRRESIDIDGIIHNYIPRKIFDREIKSCLEFDYSNLNITLDVDEDTYRKIIWEIEKILRILKIYKINVSLSTYFSQNSLITLIKSSYITIYISQSMDFISKFTKDLLFTTIELDKFYFEILNNRIDDSKIINSILSRRIEPILLHIHINPKMDTKYLSEKIIEILEKCIYYFVNGRFISWHISDEDYLSMIKLYRKYISEDIDIPKKISNNSELRYIGCKKCCKQLFFHPYYVDEIICGKFIINGRMQLISHNFFHYFCYLFGL